jgi:hypothetical protein
MIPALLISTLSGVTSSSKPWAEARKP